MDIFFLPKQICQWAAAPSLVLPCLELLSITVSAAPGLETGKRTINLHEAVTKTIEHNPDLRAFDYQLKAQQGRVVTSGGGTQHGIER